MHRLHEVLVVSHTHWDREWYHTAERFRQRLVTLVDDLLDEPPADGESFLLDGQAVLLDDYLVVRPERAEALAALLRDGRLEAGPWYVLADELIPGGEALVRNLAIGRETVRRTGGEPPPVLYCPDSFGHPAVLPELARGFGCELLVLWRGYGGARWPAGDTVRWRGPSGAEVVLYHLPPDGYEFGSSLPVTPDAAAGRWTRIASVLSPRAVTGTALLLNGADHHARQRDQRAAVAQLASAAAPIRVHASSLRGAAASIVASTARADLPVVQGELRDSYGYAWTLQGTRAARAGQKRHNALVERMLVRDVEPWLALLPAGGAGAERALVRTAWRALLRAHPHDTLCGTSIDAVAAAMDGRLASAAMQGRGLRDDAVLALIGHDREHARASGAQWRPMVVLRNPAPRSRGGVVELILSAAIADVAVGPGSATRQGTSRRVAPWTVDGMPLQLLARRERISLTESPRAYPDADRVAEVRALGWIERVPGYGIVLRAQRAGAAIAPRNPVRARKGMLENGLVRIEVGKDGDVRMTELSSGRTVNGAVSLEQAREAGDLYTPAIREALTPPRLRGIRLVHRGPLRGELTLEHELSAPGGGRGGRCRIALQIDADLSALRIIVTGDNRVGGHRLRVRVATGLVDAVTMADAAFHPVARAPLEISEHDALMEQLVPTAPLHRWVARFTANAGATLFSDGLAEYEAFPDGAVAVTLFRAVGTLSRHDLPERPGHAGWPADTPAAQAIGPFRARLALALHGPAEPSQFDAIERLADDVLLPITGETLRSNIREPGAHAGLELTGDGLAFSAAAPAQRDGWIVLRCVNRRDAVVRGRWTLGRQIEEAVRARLDETPLDALPIGANAVAFDAAPREIVTILVR